MLGVAETTVKRWADEGTLHCLRTPGGHRKFLLKDIAHFAEENGFVVGGTEPPTMTGPESDRLQLGVLTHNYGLVSEVFREEALRADRESLLAFLLYLYKHQTPLKLIVDRVLQPAFAAIGQLWEEGKLEINREHAASQATLEALVRMAAELHRKEPNGRSAVCACTEDELHELGLRGLAYSLEAEGWKVHYLGANSPAETLRAFLHVAHPDLVCLSVTSAGRNGELFHGLRKLVDEAHAYGGKVIAGGHRAARLPEHQVACDMIARSVEEAIEYSRDAFGLRPGPKKRPDNTRTFQQ